MVWALLVSSGGTDSVVEYDATTGAFIRNLVPPGGNGLNDPDGILVGNDGSLLVSSNHDSPASAEVLRYEGLTGAFSGALVQQSGGALNITSMVLGPNGDLFVSDSLGHNVREYDHSTGGLVRTFATLTHNECCPQGLAFSPNGNLFVATQSSVQEFDGVSGAFVKTFASDPSIIPTGLAFGPDGNLYVSTTIGVLRYNPTTGASLGTFVAAGSGGLGYAHSLRFGLDGRLYVADTQNNRVLRYDGATGGFVDVFVLPSGNLVQPMDIAFGWVGR